MKFLSYLIFPPSILTIPLNTKGIGNDGNGNVDDADDEDNRKIPLLSTDYGNINRELNVRLVFTLIL